MHRLHHWLSGRSHPLLEIWYFQNDSCCFTLGINTNTRYQLNLYPVEGSYCTLNYNIWRPVDFIVLWYFIFLSYKWNVNSSSEPCQIILSPQGPSGLHTSLRYYFVLYRRFCGLLVGFWPESLHMAPLWFWKELKVQSSDVVMSTWDLHKYCLQPARIKHWSFKFTSCFYSGLLGCWSYNMNLWLGFSHVVKGQELWLFLKSCFWT